MAGSLVGQDRKGAGTGVDKPLTAMQRLFVQEFAVDFNQTRAARAAGYAVPHVKAGQLMSQENIVAACDKAVKEKEARAKFKQDDVLHYLQTGLFTNLLKWFEPADDGGWMISEEDLKNIPDEIGRLIEEVEKRTVVVEKDGNKTTATRFWVKTISKSVCAGLLVKVQFGDKGKGESKVGSDTPVLIDWDALRRSWKDKQALGDPIERRIAEVRESRLLPAADPVEANGHPLPNGLKETAE